MDVKSAILEKKTSVTVSIDGIGSDFKVRESSTARRAGIADSF